MRALHSAIPSALEGKRLVNEDAFSMVLLSADKSIITEMTKWTTVNSFFQNKMRFFKGEELNLLKQHQATTADLSFVVIIFKESRGPGRQDISGSTNRQ